MSEIKLKKKSYERGELLFKAGEIGSEAYLIRKGHVSIWRQEGDQRVHLAVRSEGEIVGEMGLIDDTERSATVTAESSLEVEVLTSEEIEKMLKKAPEPVSIILHQLMESLRAANDLILMYASRPPGGCC